jgi:hypothetical protein
MARLNEQLEELGRCSPSALRVQWRNLFRAVAPDMSSDLLRRAIAWRLQERVHGGLSPPAMKAIAALQTSLARSGGVQAVAAPALKPGTRLVREWHGRTYIVLVADDGFEFEQRRYRSLSQIAREITGAAWSGPRFFGLRSRARNDAAG